MQAYEKLGAFYLGNRYHLEGGAPTNEHVLYDAKDLTTHALCVGMTGSGKTGLCLSLLEEAAIDGIPAIAIDPKGDLGNLLLTFPKLRADDFRPWVDEREAQRKGFTVEEYAANRANLWRKGLKEWEQDGTRIQRFRDAADVAIYTPGSTAGLPLTVLRSFDAPGAELMEDGDALRERVAASVSGLLALLGIDADPIRSREHILLSNILDRAWRSGKDLDIASLIGEIQQPPFDRVGVMDLESFFPAKDRFGLAMTLNNLLASPGFSTWMEGDPLDIGRLLYTPEGKPRLAILSIAHLSEEERMFFVTILLNEIVAWMRMQSGTSSLRALLYMDEVFGFFPPVANPPSKQPMLTLLKQARAYGLGVVLATQNPVDLDYKGLANCGTWFLGRLQTERDKARVLDGLEGASAAAGSNFDRARMEAVLSGLSSRVFLMNNVHEDEPALFHTRWALSYLRGPLTRKQIQKLMAPRKALMGASQASAAAAAPPRPSAAAVTVSPADAQAARPPSLPADLRQLFLPVSRPLDTGESLLYRPAVLGEGRLHYVRVAARVDLWKDAALFAFLGADNARDPWDDAEELPVDSLDLDEQPHVSGRFEELPAAAMDKRIDSKWSKGLATHLYQSRPLSIWQCKALKEYSKPPEDEGGFRVRLREKLHEERDLKVEKLRKRYTPKLRTLRERVQRAEQRVEKEEAQHKQSGLSTAVSFGTTVLGALFGRKTASVGNVSRAGSAMRSAGRTAQHKGDIDRAKETLLTAQEKLEDMEREFEQEVETLMETMVVDELEIEEIVVNARKGDLSVERLALVWAPYRVDSSGLAVPAFDALPCA